MKFWKQRDAFSCGVIAVMNARRWMGEHFSYSDVFNSLKRELKCRNTGISSTTGTNVHDLKRGLKKYARRNGYEIQKIVGSTANEVAKVLKAGHSVILLYQFVYRFGGRQASNHHGAHWAFLYGKSGARYLIANDNSNTISEKTLKRYCELHYDQSGALEAPLALVIKKKKEKNHAKNRPRHSRCNDRSPKPKFFPRANTYTR